MIFKADENKKIFVYLYCNYSILSYSNNTDGIGGDNEGKNKKYLLKSHRTFYMIIALGIIMDVIVNIINVPLIVVDDGLISNIYTAIITISVLCFTLITIISESFDKQYYGYKLSEIIQFENSPLNIINYITLSLFVVGLGTVFYITKSIFSTTNSLIMLLFAVIYLEWQVTINIYKSMIDESLFYKLIESYYNQLSENTNYAEYRSEVDHLYDSLKLSVKVRDVQQKDEILLLLDKLNKTVANKSVDVHDMNYYFFQKMSECVSDYAHNFGYDVMLKDILTLDKSLSSDHIERLKLLKIPIEELKYLNDQELLNNNYFEQLKQFYKDGKYNKDAFKDSDIVTIFSLIINSIISINSCSFKAKSQLLKDYLNIMTQGNWGRKDDYGLGLNYKVIYEVFFYKVLINDNLNEKKYVFKVIIEIIYSSYNYTQNKNYFELLTLMLLSFYAFICDKKYSDEEYYKSDLIEMFNCTIESKESNKYPKTTFASIVKKNIKGIINALWYRINQHDYDTEELSAYECYFITYRLSDIAFNIEFLFIIYLAFYERKSIYFENNTFINWNETSNESKKQIINTIIYKFDLDKKCLNDKFKNDYLEFKKLIGVNHEITEDDQKNIFDELINMKTEFT